MTLFYGKVRPTMSPRTSPNGTTHAKWQAEAFGSPSFQRSSEVIRNGITWRAPERRAGTRK